MAVDFSNAGGIADFTQAIILICALLAYPIWIAWFLIKNMDKLTQPEFKTKYDSTYINVDIFKSKALWFTSLFLGRRICFAFLIVICGQSIVMQVFLADILSTLLLAFYFSVNPMWDPINNAIQIFNEIIVLMSTWLMFWFTLYVPDPATRYDFGWNFLYMIGINFILNVMILIYSILKKIYMACKKLYMKRMKAKSSIKVKLNNK